VFDRHYGIKKIEQPYGHQRHLDNLARSPDATAIGTFRKCRRATSATISISVRLSIASQYARLKSCSAWAASKITPLVF
jgi:hypothetical protein